MKSKTSVVKKPHKPDLKIENKQEMPITETRPEDMSKKEPIIEDLKEPIIEDLKEPIIKDLKEPIIEDTLAKDTLAENEIIKETRTKSESSQAVFLSPSISLAATTDSFSASKIATPDLEPSTTNFSQTLMTYNAPGKL